MLKAGQGRFLIVPLLFIPMLLAGCPPPETPIFSFAVIADPHVTGEPDTEYAIKLAACVEWINLHRQDADKLIELVFTVGDVGWGNGLTTARDILDGLEVPYVPLIGDNEVHRSDADYEAAYATQYELLASLLDNWQKAPTPVWNPDIGGDSYFQNLSFDYAGVHFQGTDWAARAYGGGLESEQADLHDFPGGTWPWFTEDITNCDKGFEENIIMFSHHPMHIAPIVPIDLGAFSPAEYAVLEAFTGGYGSNVALNLAGHYHIDWWEARQLGGYELYVTEAVHLAGAFRLVQVHSDGSKFTYSHQKIFPVQNAAEQAPTDSASTAR